MEKLQRLIARCKAGVYLTVNEHRDNYQNTEQYLAGLAKYECPPQIRAEVRAGILRTDTSVDLVAYPDTPIGSYQIIHYDLDAALTEMLEAIGP